MGVKLSIDKHVSDLEDILEMSPHYLSRVQFESKIQADISQHLKVSPNISYISFGPLIYRNSNFIFVRLMRPNLSNFEFLIRFGDFMSPKKH